MLLNKIILIFLIGFLVGCGDGTRSGEGNNTNIGFSSSSESFSSSVDTNESIYCNEVNVSNLGEPLNARGYYGDNVCFGPFKIVGKWIMAWYENGPEIIEFRSDGTTLQYDENGAPDYELSSYYGVSEDGETLKYVRQVPASNGGGIDSDYNVFNYLETSEDYPNWIKTVFKTTSYLYSNSPQVFDNYWICRITDEGVSSCY